MRKLINSKGPNCGVFMPRKGVSSEWVRPIDWLGLPVVTASEDKMVGLYAVYDTTSEFVAFTATGNFTVDWGDGSAVDNVASGVQAQHQYTYATIPVGTLSTRGYKQVIITITPQAGQQLLSVDLNKRHTSASAQIQSSNWLDITCSCNAASTLGFTSAGTLTRSSLLERATILNGQLRLSTASMFNSCYALQSVPLFDTSFVTNMSVMFSSCRSLQIVPIFNTSSVTNMTSMFASCSSLQRVPLFNTAVVTNMAYMFASCSSLQSVPIFNTAAVTNTASMLSSCASLQSVPALILSAVTIATDMFLNALDVTRSLVTGLGVDHSYLNCNLSAAALDEIYTNLPVVVGKTITVTGNYGVAGDNPAIATGKGWTVVG